MDSDNFLCFWIIENFIYKRNSSVVLKSNIFTADRSGASFYLQINKSNYYYHDHLCINVCKVFPISKTTLNYSVSLWTSQGWIIIESERSYKFSNSFSNECENKLFSWDELENEKEKYLPDGCLTVKFLLKKERNYDAKLSSNGCLMISSMISEGVLIHEAVEFYTNLNPDDLLYIPPSRLFDNHRRVTKATQTDVIHASDSLHNQKELLKLFLEKELGFVTLRSAEKEFIVHKAILCAGSPVFRYMLQQDVAENLKNVIDISDVDKETATLLLRFLHMERIDDLSWETAVKLFYAADKYQICLLKETCVNMMMKVLKTETICEAFVFADLHRIEALKQCALEHFSQNLKTVLKSMEWKYLLHNRPELVVEILNDSSEKL